MLLRRLRSKLSTCTFAQMLISKSPNSTPPMSQPELLALLTEQLRSSPLSLMGVHPVALRAAVESMPTQYINALLLYFLLNENFSLHSAILTAATKAQQAVEQTTLTE